VRPVTVNTWLNVLNAFFGWLHERGDLTTKVRLKPLKVEKRLVPTIDAEAIRAIVTYKPPTWVTVNKKHLKRPIRLAGNDQSIPRHLIAGHSLSAPLQRPFLVQLVVGAFAICPVDAVAIRSSLSGRELENVFGGGHLKLSREWLRKRQVDCLLVGLVNADRFRPSAVAKALEE
jgi:hypothetical protein